MHMHTQIMATVLVGLIVALTSGRNFPLSRRYRHPVPGQYRLGRMTWVGVIEKGGENETYQGTIQEIAQEILRTHKDFSWKKLWENLGSPIPARDDPPKSDAPFNCNVTWVGDGEGNGIYNLAVDLTYNLGACVVEAGPRMCVLASCSNNDGEPVGIWLCNDHDEELALPCSDVGVYAQSITIHCLETGQWTGRGQRFMFGYWNVIVGAVGGGCPDNT